MLKKSLFTLACSLMLLLTGCSSIICGSRQSLSINSNPAGAEVLVYDCHGDIVFQQITPCTASLLRTAPEEGRANYIVLMRKEGFTPVQIPLTSHVNAAYLANIMFGGVGLIVDSFSGSMWTLNADGLDATLFDRSAAVIHEDQALMIGLREQPAERLVAHMDPSQTAAIPLESLARAVRPSGE